MKINFHIQIGVICTQFTLTLEGSNPLCLCDRCLLRDFTIFRQGLPCLYMRSVLQSTSWLPAVFYPVIEFFCSLSAPRLPCFQCAFLTPLEYYKLFFHHHMTAANTCDPFDHFFRFFFFIFSLITRQLITNLMAAGEILLSAS